METKRFTVVDTRSNTVKTFNSTATTVGELKRDLRAVGIDPDGMAIQEGLTKTELGTDNAELPKDVTYRGSVTNNLVFRLTQPNKKIKSGSDCCTVNEINDKIKNFIKEITGAVYELHKEEAKPDSKGFNDKVVDAIATLTSILVHEDLITEDQGNSVLEPLMNVKIFDSIDDDCAPVPFEYDLEELFEGM